MAHDEPRAQWRKSSRSGNGNCVEVTNLDANIGVRDSKDPDTGHLTLTPETWAAFVSHARAGHYDQ